MGAVLTLAVPDGAARGTATAWTAWPGRPRPRPRAPRPGERPGPAGLERIVEAREPAVAELERTVAGLEPGLERAVAALERAVAGLAPDAAQVVRLIGVHPGPSADAAAVAALAGIPRSAARDALSRLAAARLVEAAGAGRWGIDDRLRAYAARQPARESTAARQRLLRHLGATAAAAAAVGYPHGPAVALPPFGSAAAARAWLDAELPTLLAVADPAFARRLAPVLDDHLTARGRAGDVLGLALLGSQRYGEAAEQFRRCLARCRERGDRAGEAAALAHLAACRQRQGRRVEALAWYAEAYDCALRCGDRAVQAVAVRGLAQRSDHREPSLV